MKRSEFSYHLPENLIAQHPPARREDSRLLCLDRHNGHYQDRTFHELPDLLQPGDLLVFNDTRVIPARLYGAKASGGEVELLIERLIDEQRFLCQIRASKAPKTGSLLRVGDFSLTVEQRDDRGFYLLNLISGQLMSLLQRHGHIPLPPYIRRDDTRIDSERYQTVYAKNPGAVAAPTAGLHFSTELLEQVRRKGVNTGFVTLHVGAGTFQPMRVDDINEHVMHREWFTVDEQLCKTVAATRNAGRRVIAVGTTVVRCLESAATDDGLLPAARETEIFIYPGYRFRAIDGLITNFHLPESTLLMLVCAFAGMTNTLNAYQHALEQQYRFFSYGDAMFIV